MGDDSIDGDKVKVFDARFEDFDLISDDSIDGDKVKVFEACICCYEGCLAMDDCQVGCAGNETCLCIHTDFCCKSGTEKLCCLCCALKCESPTTCLKSEGQCCCLVGAAAIPPDSEVPCMIAQCCIMCYPKMGFGIKVSECKS